MRPISFHGAGINFDMFCTTATPSSPKENPLGPEAGKSKVPRGAWGNGPRLVRVSNSNRVEPWGRGNYVGSLCSGIG
jgi:hypothetical protein